MTTENQKLITCIVPFGAAPPVVQKLKDEKNLVTVSVNSARGVSHRTASGHMMLGDQTEKQVLSVVVPEDRADEIFEFIYIEAGIDRPHGGFMYIHGLARTTPFELPDLPGD